MPTGSPDEGIFGSPDLSEFCCSSENQPIDGSSLLSSPNKKSDSSSSWSNVEEMKLKSEEIVPEKLFQSSGSTHPNSPDSGDEDDILGLISSSLDRFNAQIHHVSASRAFNNLNNPLLLENFNDIPVRDMVNGSKNLPTNMSMLSSNTWGSFAKSQSTQNGISSSLGCPNNSSGGLQQNSIPSPPGLPRIKQQPQAEHQQSSSISFLKPNGMDGLSCKKQRTVSQTFSDSDETASSLWDSPKWKALPSDMAMLSVDSGIDGSDRCMMPSWFNGVNSAVNTNSSSSSCSVSNGDCVGHNGSAAISECCNGSSFPALNNGNFSPNMDSFPPNTHYQAPTQYLKPTATPSTQTFDFSFDPNLLKQAAVMAAAAAHTANEGANKGGSHAMYTPNDLRSFFLPLQNSWPNTTDCSPSTEAPQMHFRPGDNHHQQNHQMSSRFEAALRQQQQQQSRQIFNRRKADSICFSSRLNTGLLSSTNNNNNNHNGMKSHIGQLGSPPPSGDLCQQMSKSFANGPQKFARDLPRCVGKSNNGVLGAPKSRGAVSSRTKRSDLTPSFSSSSSTSSSEIEGKPVIAKWRRACSFYLRGHCKKEDCEFAHDLSKVTCKFWESGECFKGNTCPFLHGYPPELFIDFLPKGQPELSQLKTITQTQKQQNPVDQVVN